MNHQAILDAWEAFHAVVRDAQTATEHHEAVAFLDVMDAHATEQKAAMLAAKAEHDAGHK